MRRRTLVPLAALASVAAIAAGALAGGTALAASNPVISDCVAHGQLTRSYSLTQLHQALGALTAETREYTNCQDVINRALAAAVSGKSSGGTGSSGSGSFLPTPVIIVLVVLILAAVTFGALAIRRRRGGDPGS
jgi:hypothetical protein